MLTVFLIVDKPVASLQFDLDTDASAVRITLPQPLMKQVMTRRLENGRLRVIIYGLDRDTFSGKFGEVEADVRGVSNVMGSDVDANDAHAVVTTLSPPKDVKAEVEK